MRVLVDQQMGRDIVDALRGAGVDTDWVEESAPSLPDVEVLAWAQESNRVLITFDKGFGDLVLKQRLPSRAGVVLFRDPPPLIEDVAIWIVETVLSRESWKQLFATVRPRGIRLVLIPD